MSIRKLENIHRILEDKEPIGPDVQENLAALVGEVIDELKAKQHPGPRPADTPPHIPPVGGGG